MTNYGWETLEQRRIIADTKMYDRMIAGKAAVDKSRFSLHISDQHNTRHGATKGTISTDVAKYSFKHRIHKVLKWTGVFSFADIRHSVSVLPLCCPPGVCLPLCSCCAAHLVVCCALAALWRARCCLRGLCAGWLVLRLGAVSLLPTQLAHPWSSYY